MGTSSSNPGPGSNTPLVPPWADTDGKGPGPKPPAQRFRQFRRDLGRFVRSGDERYLRSALRHYARDGLGGSATAARRFAPVAQSGSRLLALLSDISVGGDGVQWLGFNINELAGQNVDDVIEEIINALCPPGENPDDEASRHGMNEALSRFLGAAGNFDPAAVSRDMIADLLMEYLCEEVFIRIVNDSGHAFNQTDDPMRTVQAENDLVEFIRSVVDVTVGPFLQNENLILGQAEFQRLLQEIIREVFAEFEGYE